MAARSLLRRAAGTVGGLTFAGLSVVAVKAPPPQQEPSRADAAASPTASPSATPTPDPVPRATHVPTRTTGPGITSPGVSAVTYIYGSGVLDVSETIKLPEKTTKVRLRALTSDLPVVKAMHPVVENLQIDAGGAPVAAPSLKVPGSAELTLPQASDTLAVRYQVTGSTQRSKPAPAGRVLTALPIITPEFGSSTTTKVTIDMTNTGVLNLTCPLMATADQVCGTKRGETWTTGEVPWKKAFALAQVNLPSPGQS